jgi:DNA-binding MarR family transcriptional regulator
MPLQPQCKVFGTVLRTHVLLAIALTGETFPSELARLIETKLYPVQRVLDSLEREGLVASRKIGVERRVTLNPRFFARAELEALLIRLGEQDRKLRQTLARRRSRPRRRGKPL